MYNETNVKESVYGLTNIPNVEMSRRRHQMTIMGVRCILTIKKAITSATPILHTLNWIYRNTFDKIVGF